MLLKVMHDSIFYSQHFWFYVFVILVVMYVAATFYYHIKRPRKGIKAVNVRVEAVHKVRVQTAPRNTGNDELKSNLAQVPGSRFDVTFTDDENNDAFVFAMSEKECEDLQIGDTGVLRYNGGSFISFKRKEK